MTKIKKMMVNAGKGVRKEKNFSFHKLVQPLWKLLDVPQSLEIDLSHDYIIIGHILKGLSLFRDTFSSILIAALLNIIKKWKKLRYLSAG